MRECSISAEHYLQILQEAIRAGYMVQSLAQYDASRQKPAVILRHDVDVSLAAARRLAELEYSEGASSTYFIRVHGRYNPFDRQNHGHLRWLVDHGFDVGLHHEVGLFDLNGTSPREQLGRELEVLSSVLGAPVKSVSAHLPKHARSALSPDDLQDHGILYEAGDERFNLGASFVSDSNRRLKPCCPCTLIGRSELIYATIHPIWWVEAGTDAEALVGELLRGE